MLHTLPRPREIAALFDKLRRPRLQLQPGLRSWVSWADRNAPLDADLVVALSCYVSTYSDTVFGIQRTRTGVQAIEAAARIDAELDARAAIPHAPRISGEQALAAYCRMILRESPGDCRRAKASIERVLESRARVRAGLRNRNSLQNEREVNPSE